MKPPLSRACKVNTSDQMFEIRDQENGVPDPLRYDVHVDAPQEVARMFADLAPLGSRVLDVGCGTGSVSRIIADAREAKMIGIKPAFASPSFRIALSMKKIL